MKQRVYIVTPLMRQLTAGGAIQGAACALWREREREMKKECCQIEMTVQKLSLLVTEHIFGKLWNTEAVVPYISDMYFK